MWQRFGRAVRDLKLQGKALFLVEPRYFDEYKEKQAKAAEERKRKRIEKDANQARGPTAKRTRAEGGSSAATHIAEDGNSDSDDDSDAEDEEPPSTRSTQQTAQDDPPNEAEQRLYIAERRAMYEKAPNKEWKKGKRTPEDIEPAMDDVINARSRPLVGCSRKPVRIQFKQDNSE